MRWIARIPTPNQQGSERGASAIIVAILMVALLGFAAISIDVGRIYWERAQLQNGADAAALSIALDCSKGKCAAGEATAPEFANNNANDTHTEIKHITYPSPGTVRVETGALSAAGEKSLGLTFARVFGFDETQVNAYSVAAWGGPTGGTFAFPLAFSECALHEFIATNAASSGKSWLKFKGDSPSCISIYHAAGIVPGGWGYLDPNADAAGTSDGACVLTLDLTVKTVYDGKEGSSIPGTACKAKLGDWISEANANGYAEVYFPVFSEFTGTGGGKFTIQGIAAFRIYAWKLSGGGTPDTHKDSSYPGCSGSCRGVYGEFVRMMDKDELTGGGGQDLGVTRPPSLIE